MKKGIRIFAILSEIVAFLSLLGVLVCIFLQKSLLPLYLSGQNMPSQFIFPAAPVVYALLLGAILLLPCFLCGKENTGIAGEIITVCLLVLLPGIQSGLSSLQVILISRFSGVATMAALSALNSICQYPLGLAHLASSLALLVCGMSIAYKKMKA